MQFQPSQYSRLPPVRRNYGEAELTPEEAAAAAEAEKAAMSDYISYFNMAAPGLASLLSGGGSARERYEKALVKYENYKKLYKGTSNRLLKNIYGGQMDKIAAQIKVLEIEMQQESETDDVIKAGKVMVVV